MTRKRSCVVREEADGAGPVMVPRYRPTSLMVWSKSDSAFFVPKAQSESDLF